MKVYMIIYDTQEGYIVYHIASTREKAKDWIKRHFLNDRTIDIVEVEVDKEERL